MWPWKPTRRSADRDALDEPRAPAVGVATPIVSARTSSRRRLRAAARTARRRAPGSTRPSNGQPKATLIGRPSSAAADAARRSPRRARPRPSSDAFPLRRLKVSVDGERAVDAVEPGGGEPLVAALVEDEARALDARRGARARRPPPRRRPSAARARRGRSETASIARQARPRRAGRTSSARGRRRQHLRLVLEPVPRADVADRHAHGRSLRSSPRVPCACPDATSAASRRRSLMGDRGPTARTPRWYAKIMTGDPNACQGAAPDGREADPAPTGSMSSRSRVTSAGYCSAPSTSWQPLPLEPRSRSRRPHCIQLGLMSAARAASVARGADDRERDRDVIDHGLKGEPTGRPDPRRRRALGAHRCRPNRVLFSVTLRVRLDGHPGSFARLAGVIGDAGGLLGAIDLVASNAGRRSATSRSSPPTSSTSSDRRRGWPLRRDPGRGRLRPRLPRPPGRQDRGVRSADPTRDDLSMAYTPGVARVCRRSRTTRRRRGT